MTDVTPLLKDKSPCGCGLECGLFGTLNKHGCVRGCTKCPKCRGARNRRSGLKKQREARKALGVAPNKFGDSNEENWADVLFANEVKAGAQVRPAATAWLRIETQVISNRPDHGGQHKPTRAVLMPDGWGKDGLVMVRLSTWRDLIRPALEHFYELGEAE